MKHDLYELEILPVSDIIEHEIFDAGRTDPLIDKIQREKELINPILVTPLKDGGYMQLDGMNRLSAFRKMGIPTICCQIVDYSDDDAVQLMSWSHVFGLPANKLFSIFEMANIRLEKISRVHAFPSFSQGHIATCVLASGEVYEVHAQGDDGEKAAAIVQLVSEYKSRGIQREILSSPADHSSISYLFGRYSRANGIMIFPLFLKEHIIKLVLDGGVLPAGITRHIVKHRVLNARIPLSLMSDAISLSQKNTNLNTYLSNRHVRVYQEPVLYLE